MSEGGIYLCKWKRTGGKYVLELVANPSLTVSGKNLETCMEDLCMEIIGWNGDGEAVLELFPPRKGKRIEGGGELFKAVGWNDRTYPTDYASLFEGGVCETCKHGLGGRNATGLDVSEPPKGLVVGITRCFPGITIYHRQFIDALNEQERAAFEARPVTLAGEATEYVEAIPHEVIALVGYKGASYPDTFQQNFKCGECGWINIWPHIEDLPGGTKILDARDVESRDSELIFASWGGRDEMLIPLDRWKEILSEIGRRGLTTSRVYVVESDYVEHPSPKVFDEFDWIL